jgi:hypothetical protein
MSGKTLAEYRALSREKGEPAFIGNLSYLAREYSSAAHAGDMWNLTILLFTTLAYLYTRSASTTFAVVTLAYFAGYLVYYAVSALTRKTSADVNETHEIFGSLLSDAVLATLAFLAVFFIVEYTLIGSEFSKADGQLLETTWITVIVLLLSLLSGFVAIYWLSLPLLLGGVWILCACNSSRADPEPRYAVYLAQLASLFTVVYYAAFLTPLRKSFVNNAYFVVGVVVWIAALLELVHRQQ